MSKKDNEKAKESKMVEKKVEVKEKTVKESLNEERKSEKLKFNRVLSPVLICIAVVMLLTWFLASVATPEMTLDHKTQLGIFDVFGYFGNALNYAYPMLFYVLVIGGFYGVLYNIPSYKELLKKIASSFNGKENIFFIIVITLLALFTSVFGASLPLLMIVPMLISVIVLMGYNRITAALVTVGSIAVGLLGTTFGVVMSETFTNGFGSVNSALGLTGKTQIVAKIIALVFGIVLLIVNTIFYARKHKDNNNDSNIFAPTISTEGKKIKTIPIMILIDVTLLVLILSVIPWSSMFGVNCFTKLAESISKHQSVIHTGILSGLRNFFKDGLIIFGNVVPFEQWTASEFSMTLVISSIVIAIVYRMGIKKFFNSFIQGAKRAIKPAMILMLIYLVFSIDIRDYQFDYQYYAYMTYSTSLSIIKPLLHGAKGLNVFVMSLVSLISNLFSVELTFSSIITLPFVATVITDTSVYSVIALIWQFMHGFVTLVAPTSVILMVILSYLHISYTEWLKSSWKLLLEILVLILLIPTFIMIIM